MRPNRKLPLLFTLLLGCSLFGLSSCAQQAFYYPDHADYGTPAQAGLQHEDIFFQSEDGTRLHGWFIPAQNAGGLIPARATISISTATPKTFPPTKKPYNGCPRTVTTYSCSTIGATGFRKAGRIRPDCLPTAMPP